MLKVITSPKQLNRRQLLDVYQESIDNDANNKNRELPIGLRTIESEQDFLNYLWDFFALEGAFLALWEIDGIYAASVRVELYKDGYLITGLETMPGQRRKGYARELLKGVIRYLELSNPVKIYSHIKKMNIASLQTHLTSGFCVVSDHAVLLDGSVFTDYYTLSYQNK